MISGVRRDLRLQSQALLLFRVTGSVWNRCKSCCFFLSCPTEPGAKDACGGSGRQVPVLVGWHLRDTGLSVAPCGLSSRQGGSVGSPIRAGGCFPPCKAPCGYMGCSEVGLWIPVVKIQVAALCCLSWEMLVLVFLCVEAVSSLLPQL